jgi:hypothetical protein
VYNEVCLPLGSFHIDASDSGSKKGK